MGLKPNSQICPFSLWVHFNVKLEVKKKRVNKLVVNFTRVLMNNSFLKAQTLKKKKKELGFLFSSDYMLVMETINPGKELEFFYFIFFNKVNLTSLIGQWMGLRLV